MLIKYSYFVHCVCFKYNYVHVEYGFVIQLKICEVVPMSVIFGIFKHLN